MVVVQEKMIETQYSIRHFIDDEKKAREWYHQTQINEHKKPNLSVSGSQQSSTKRYLDLWQAVDTQIGQERVLERLVELWLDVVNALDWVKRADHLGEGWIDGSLIKTWLLVRQLHRVALAQLTKLTLEVVKATLELVLATLGLLEVQTEVALALATHLLATTGVGLVLLKLCDAAAEELVDDLELRDAGLERGVTGDELLKGLWHVEAVHGGLGAAWGGGAAHAHGAGEGWVVELVIDEVVVEGVHVVAVHVWGSSARDWGVRAIRVSVLGTLGWTTLVERVLLLLVVQLCIWVAHAVAILVKERLRGR